jgi:endonuclease/exonuclease/phosphatase family metal-dependent hydrolase
MLRILCTNLGYGRNIDGSFGQHVAGAWRHFYAPLSCQRDSLAFVREQIEKQAPHLSCFLEIDQGSLNNRFLDQLATLRSPDFHTFSATNKYGLVKPAGKLSISKGKSNAFMSSLPVTHRTHFFRHGTKKLVYEITVHDRLTVFLVHCSLRPWIRQKQFEELRYWAEKCPGKVLLIGDFNNFQGEKELLPLTGSGFQLLNDTNIPTFRFGQYETCVDLCLISPGLAGKARLEVINQPSSDHQMLLVDIDI